MAYLRGGISRMGKLMEGRDAQYHLDQVGEGWHKLVHPLLVVCQQYGGVVVQVKEKFGGLRFYYEEPLMDDETPPETLAFWDVFDMAVRNAESRSQFTCEFTGKYGKICHQSTEGKPLWWKTMSPEVAAEKGYAYPEDKD